MNFYDKEPQFVNKEPSKLREHIRKGLTAFLVIVAGVLFFFAVFRFESIAAGVKKVIEVLAPVTIGLVLAFLLNPIVKWLEKILHPVLMKVLRKEERARKAGKAIGIFGALIFALAIVTALFNMLIPELYKSIRDLVVTLPHELSSWGENINNYLKDDTTTNRIIKATLLEVGDSLEEWVQTDLVKWAQTDLLAQTGNLVSSVTAGVMSVVNVVTNILVGIIVSAYALFSKEKFMNQSKKVIYALLPVRKANITLHIARKANEIFSGFIIGKIIDSAIIGVLCFIGLSILKMPYTLLVSVIVGVTNVIPFFGPYFGAIPSTILIMLVDPMKGFYFVIFIILLQQLDGNVIGPKILGDSTGLSSFWVIFSILVSGGLFGLPGMIMGVPTFALIYYIVKMIIQQKLEHKRLPINTEEYTEKSYVDDNGVFVASEKEKVDEEEKKDADSSAE